MKYSRLNSRTLAEEEPSIVSVALRPGKVDTSVRILDVLPCYSS